MKRFVKRLQSRLSYAGIRLSMAQVAEYYTQYLSEDCWENPSEDLLGQVFEYVKRKSENEIQESGVALTITEPEELEPISQELVPQPQDLALTTQVPEESAIASPIPQSEVTGIVNQVFASQPPALKEQLTDYAMQHAFGDIRQVQEFLEQLRSMEFELMVQTLQDHVKRRGSMLALLDGIIGGQRQQDQEGKTDFFNHSQQNLTNFREEMMSRLAKQSL